MNKTEAKEIIKETEDWLQLTRTTKIYTRARIVVKDLLKVIEFMEEGLSPYRKDRIEEKE